MNSKLIQRYSDKDGNPPYFVGRINTKGLKYVMSLLDYGGGNTFSTLHTFYESSLRNADILLQRIYLLISFNLIKV